MHHVKSMNNDNARQRSAYRALVFMGGVPLLIAMSVDTVAVIGRLLRAPLNGSIEIVQFALLISGSLAILVATVAGTHVAVRLLFDRTRGRARIRLQRLIHIVAALYFLALLVGGVWLGIDAWYGYEQTEILGLPYRPLRIVANLSVAAVCVVFVHRAFLPESK